jgi:thioredoxin reductase (NADPH)
MGEMAQPAFVVVDDDGDTVAELSRTLKLRFGADYQIFAEQSPKRALAVLERLHDDGDPVAVVIADLWMPEMSGLDFLVRSRELHPTARRALLFGAYDRSADESICQGMALGWVDTWLWKPWQPAEHFLHLRIGELLSEWVMATDQPAYHPMRVVAEPDAPRTHDLKDFGDRNDLSVEFLTPDSAEGQQLLQDAGQDGSRLPVAMYFNGRVQVDPSYADVADAMGLRTRPDRHHYDVAVIGAGPAGLSAAVNSASEGLCTLMLEPRTLGGQASSTSMIRNYLGFPRGVSGRQLCANAFDQSILFGAELVFDHAAGLSVQDNRHVLTLGCGGQVTADAVVVSVGVEYRRLGAAGVDELLGAGVFYGAAVSEAPAMQGKPVFVVGAGNSAGQAAVHLAKYAEHVTMLVRGNTLTKTMSDYLIKEIQASPTITVRLNTQVVGGGGNGRLEHLTLHDAAAGGVENVTAFALFLLIGAQPNTEWLGDTLARDANGFLLTGQDLPASGALPDGWPLDRQPLPLETSVPGVFAVGDVRYGSAKRVATAVGEGANAIQVVHQYLGPR